MMIGSLTLDQLTVLVTIADTGSFSAAGRKLRRVQSAISNTVRTLETTQQVLLFDRSGRSPRLTEAGRVLVAQARQVLRQAELFERTAGAIAGGLEPELTIAIDSMTPTGPVLRTLSKLQSTFPDLPVTLFTESIWAAERRVRDGSAMISLCGLFPTAGQDLEAHVLTKITLVPVVAPSHPLATESREITRETLADYVQLILTDPHAPDGPSHGVVSARFWRFVDMLRRLEFLLAGFGWCSMPLHLVERHLQDGSLVRLDVKDSSVLPVSIPIYAVRNRNRPLGNAARWLLNELVEDFRRCS
ncbi:LysR family transcriptional regulator [Rhizobium tumorigenes]|uniref:LysR family transcriptional regulator n=1 Tax=Rhizobium tumorigenes TaxID=2041385 RepID=UPI00241EF08D|nr:LysR family transcriptional regulator [Rhizobium tumorigenes]WFS00035.1 LysR family transcriptional regulator [Rhizobium tumorigenes]